MHILEPTDSEVPEPQTERVWQGGLWVKFTGSLVLLESYYGAKMAVLKGEPDVQTQPIHGSGRTSSPYYNSY